MEQNRLRTTAFDPRLRPYDLTKGSYFRCFSFFSGHFTSFSFAASFVNSDKWRCHLTSFYIHTHTHTTTYIDTLTHTNIDTHTTTKTQTYSNPITCLVHTKTPNHPHSVSLLYLSPHTCSNPKKHNHSHSYAHSNTQTDLNTHNTQKHTFLSLNAQTQLQRKKWKYHSSNKTQKKGFSVFSFLVLSFCIRLFILFSVICISIHLFNDCCKRKQAKMSKYVLWQIMFTNFYIFTPINDTNVLYAV